MLLEKINSPSDLKKLSIDELTDLAVEMRRALMNRLTKKGGHFGPNFGFVEATIALHYVFDSPNDKFVFDVSHQSYCHKMLTGRKDAYLDEAKFNEVSGYTNPDESEHDFFNVGHTSTSVSLASGLAKARDLKGEKSNIVAIIGDGSLSGGEALEGIDYIGEQETNFIMVVNDNDMSIAENHGGLYKNLKELRDSDGKCPNNIFKAFGLDYVYVADGHDLKKLIEVFQKVKDIDHPIAVHLNTVKGKGYKPAETHKEPWHWCAPFKEGLEFWTEGRQSKIGYDSLTRDFLLEKMKNDPKVCTIAAGIPTNIGFTREFRLQAGKQFVDVGIAEEHAVALASGMAKNGGKPVFATHSSFFQRTYDQVAQDLCINSNPATLLVNTASVYGMNDVTHLGIYDIPMLSNIPNLVYLAPTNAEEYFAMLDWSIEQDKYPVAVRIPCNGVIHTDKEVQKDYSDLNKYQTVQSGSKIAVLALGDLFQLGEATAKEIEERSGVKPTLINPRFITGLDEEMLEELKKSHTTVVTIEDGSIEGGFGEKIARFYGPSGMKVFNYGLKKEFVDRYVAKELMEKNRLSPTLIADDVL